ncbi:MAG TPA: nicotinate-nucleotide diphosphorylase (carboxylating) [Longimicrobiales bacterium]
MSTHATPVEDSAEARLLAVDETALRFVDFALGEDLGSGDWTTRWTVPPRARVEATLVAGAAGVVAGLPVAAAVFRRLSPKVEATLCRASGDALVAGETIAVLCGPARAILAGEHTALGILGRLSGIATFARRYVTALAGTGAAVLGGSGTPGWRALEAVAMRAGGAVPHRVGLDDAVVLRPTHLAVAGSTAEAVRRARDLNTRALRIEVEVADEAGAAEAVAAGADVVLLSSMDLETIRAAARRIARGRVRPLLCVSADVPPEAARALADAGADAILLRGLPVAAPLFPVALTCTPR